jgi:hypothetical protein
MFPSCVEKVTILCGMLPTPNPGDAEKLWDRAGGYKQEKASLFVVSGT